MFSFLHVVRVNRYSASRILACVHGQTLLSITWGVSRPCWTRHRVQIRLPNTMRDFLTMYFDKLLGNKWCRPNYVQHCVHEGAREEPVWELSEETIDGRHYNGRVDLFMLYYGKCPMNRKTQSIIQCFYVVYCSFLLPGALINLSLLSEECWQIRAWSCHCKAVFYWR